MKRLSAQEMIDAWQARDASYDALFCFGVKTTGIFCRPSCPSRPKLEHIEFFSQPGEAVQAGYRPCKRCQPELAVGTPPPWVARLLQLATEQPDQTLSTRQLRAWGIAPERARRWFQKHHGMSFAAWCRGLRLSHAFQQLHQGADLEDVILGHGYESHSGFRQAFSRVFGRPPGRAKLGDCLRVSLVESPLGPLLAAANQEQLCLLEFVDRCQLEVRYAELKRRLALPVVPGENALLQQLRAELGEYFAGARRQFSLKLAQPGTPFQQHVWEELQRIPYGTTASYDTLARRVQQPAAVRAVARANATNRLIILVPCHRVIAKNGTLSGYGGGVWRKRLLLELERTGRLP